MQKINKVARRALLSGTTIAVVGMLSHAMVSTNAQAQAAGGTGGTGGTGTGGSGGGDTVPTCVSLGLTNPVYLGGSTAVASVMDAIGPVLAKAATPLTVVYTSAGSCDGVNTITAGLKLSSSATYFDSNGVKGTCSLSNQTIDIGLSDVFPTSCPGIAAADLAGIGDFAGPVQAMNFAVPIAAQATSISAAAAYLTVGLGADGGTDWNKPALYAFRNFQSGTETMIAKAIKLDTSKWPAAADKGGAGAVVSALKTPAGPADQTIGILASNQTDGNRDTIKRLAFQGYDQSCALYPDSSYASKDKENVRNGSYEIWGPLHMLAKVDGTGAPTDAKAKQLLDILLGNTTLAGVDPVDLEISANTVPQCAMRVKRTSEIGKPVAFSPEGACGCFFDSKRGDASACVACTAANAATVCKGSTPTCSHGFCEVK